nr:hypothetical protein [Microbispora sp. GKU 823]
MAGSGPEKASANTASGPAASTPNACSLPATSAVRPPDSTISSSSPAKRISMACTACCLATSRLRNLAACSSAACSAGSRPDNGRRQMSAASTSPTAPTGKSAARVSPRSSSSFSSRGGGLRASPAATARAWASSRSAPAAASTRPIRSTTARGRSWSRRSTSSTPEGPAPREIAVARASPLRTIPTRACWRWSVYMAETAWETSVNGTAGAISSSGRPASRQALTSSGGVLGVCGRSPKTIPAALASRTFATNSAALACPAHRPLVSTSSRSLTYGEGSGSSVLWTHATGSSRAPSGPGTSTFSFSDAFATRDRNVNTV